MLESLPVDNPFDRAEVLSVAVVAAVAVGDEDAARGHAAELRRTADLVGTDALMASASAAEAVVASDSEAVRLWTEAVRRFSVSGLRFDEAVARLPLAEVLLAVGDDVAARSHLATATEVFVELSAADYLARARKAATATGLTTTRPLSVRELDVLRLVAQGLSNSDIAAALVLSEHTVHRHVANILTKLDQSSRTGAASYAFQAGLL